VLLDGFVLLQSVYFAVSFYCFFYDCFMVVGYVVRVVVAVKDGLFSVTSIGRSLCEGK
jgi:hypothetical protein